MKGRRKHKATGGENEAEQDIKDKPADRSSPNNIAKESEEMKKGGRTKKAHGGKAIGVISGEEPKAHAGRKPRKSGGRTGSEANPFTGARKGKMPPGHTHQTGSTGEGVT